MILFRWLFRFWVTASAVLVFTILNFPELGHAQSDGLVLWNTLGSQAEVENSEVGPGGTFDGGGFTQGACGGAYVANELEHDLVTFPAEIVPTARGAIEFWAKLIDFPSSIPVSDSPSFIDVAQPQVLPPGITGIAWTMSLNANDGCGGGGLSGKVGLSTDSVCTGLAVTSSGHFGSVRYEEVLGAGRAADWHHYALAWDQDGVPQRVVVFLDGNPVSVRWQDRAPQEFPAMPPGNKLGLIRMQSNTPIGSVAIDDLKIWNYAKTDFSDRVFCIPACDLQLSQDVYFEGDVVIANQFRLANPAPDPVPIELKLWFEVPGHPPQARLREGMYGELVLPAELDEDFGPFTGGTVTPSHPPGAYEFNCRLLDPVTGESLSLDVNPFEIQ